MKKNLLIAALVLPLLSVSAQWTQTSGTVVVKPGTLKFVEQGYKVNGTSEVYNEGNVNVRGDFDASTATASAATGQGFHNVWTSRNEYGQLIINEASTASGTIDSQYKIPGGFVYTPVTFPFTDMDAGKAASQAGISSTTFQDFTPTSDDGFMPGRYQNTVWTWNNSTAGNPKTFFFQHENAATNGLSPEFYHALNGATAAVKPYLGVPQNQPITLVADAYAITTAWDANNMGELYASYVEDVAVAKPTDWGMPTAADNEQPGVADGVDANGYGDNISLWANPFTSNIQLNANGNALTNVTHVFYIAGNSYTADSNGTTDAAQVFVTTLDGSGNPATGDTADALKVRPHETFFFKGSGDVNVNLGENVKTFEAATTTNLIGRNGNDNGFYQVTLSLFNNVNEPLNNRAYVFASEQIQPNIESRYEAYNTTLSNVGFYSLQENADGTVYQELADQKVLINGVNASDYVAKPINMVFKGNGEYTVTFDLTQNLVNSGNKFYFEDRLTDEIFEVDADFAYSFTNEGTTTDRFFMYWNGTPETMAVNDVTLSAQTLVYKDNKEFKVRFAKTWNQADIFVYNMMGQLVHVAKGLNASVDYTLPLKGQVSAYIVKAVNENGEVATQKIVKQ